MILRVFLATLGCIAIGSALDAAPLPTNLQVQVGVYTVYLATTPIVQVACAASNSAGAASSMLSRFSQLRLGTGSNGIVPLPVNPRARSDEGFGAVSIPVTGTIPTPVPTPTPGPHSTTLPNFAPPPPPTQPPTYDPAGGAILPGYVYSSGSRPLTVLVPLNTGSGSPFDPVVDPNWECQLFVNGLTATAFNSTRPYFSTADFLDTVTGTFSP